MYLADTNVISELMRPVPHAGVQRWADGLDHAAAFAASVVSFDEIIFGLTHKPRPNSLERFNVLAAHCVVLDVTETIARRAGEIRGLLAQRGKVCEQADMLIAATAQVHAITLVTRNVRDFDGCGIVMLNPFEAG
ncbi:PIN domain-containing protein [Xylophilus sp.]|uniref:PIN domain-containing protein n=1 Tax=Xylophilus sp. TaxID=2653893 RepID=UPI0013BBBE40|nr:PIN domain-containing protein [Xylophilus sp.]KAF1046506.1 MAG: Toxin FitB [Xylophilus sp.]